MRISSCSELEVFISTLPTVGCAAVVLGRTAPTGQTLSFRWRHIGRCAGTADCVGRMLQLVVLQVCGLDRDARAGANGQFLKGYRSSGGIWASVETCGGRGWKSETRMSLCMGCDGGDMKVDRSTKLGEMAVTKTPTTQTQTPGGPASPG